MCVQGKRAGIIIGVCVGGLAIIIIAIVLAGKRKLRTNDYIYTAAGSTMGTTAAFTDFSGTISHTRPHPAVHTHRRDGSCSGPLSPAVASPSAASSPHTIPQVPPTMFFDEDSPRSGNSEEGGTSEPQPMACAAAGPPSASGQPTTLSLPGQADAVAEQDGDTAIAD